MCQCPTCEKKCTDLKEHLNSRRHLRWTGNQTGDFATSVFFGGGLQRRSRPHEKKPLPFGGYAPCSRQRLSAGGFQPPRDARTITSDSARSLIDRIPFNSDISFAKVSAFDFGSGETAMALEQAPPP